MALVRRLGLRLDEQGWRDVAVLLEDMLASAQRIHDDSAVRAAKGETDLPPAEAEIGLVLFHRPPRST